MLDRKIIKTGCIAVILCLLMLQSGCGLAARLKKPIQDFRAATNLVTASTEAGYLIVNRSVMDRFLKKAQCVDIDASDDCITVKDGEAVSPIKPKEVRNARIFSDKAIKARLEAFQTLNKYVGLLAAIATSDKPEKIATSANELKDSIDALATKIAAMSQSGSSGESTEGNQAINNNSANFVNTVNLFTTAISEVLAAVAERKRDKALKDAIQKGTEPTQALMAAIRSDLDSFWAITIIQLNKEREIAFEAFNDELQSSTTKGKRPDSAKLESLRQDVIDTLEKQSKLEASNPKEAIEGMEKAHKALVDAANQPIQKNFVAALSAVEGYVRAATRLGTAIVKLSEGEKDH